MEDLYFNANAAFTKWVTEKNLLQQPFVLIDVGVQGGANIRWNLLGEYLVVHGFDPIEETIAELRRSNAGKLNHHYYDLAIGETDGEATFYYNADNPTASSMYSQGTTRFDRQLSERARTVSVRTLNSLFAEEIIPRADFLKVDVEGFEKSVFLGAQKFLSSGLLGVETETNFRVSPEYLTSYFSAISDILVEQRFTVFDFGFNRIPRSSFTQALKRQGAHRLSAGALGQPSTINILFCRDLIDERDAPQNYVGTPASVTLDQIIKVMIVYELYGLNDIAVDTATRFRDLLSKRFNIDKAITLLASVGPRSSDIEAKLRDMEKKLHDTENSLHDAEKRIRAIESSTSWRMTAPFRATKNLLSRPMQRRGRT